MYYELENDQVASMITLYFALRDIKLYYHGISDELNLNYEQFMKI